jgi:hypothetical protein
VAAAREPKTIRCDKARAEGRLAKAKEFLQAAQLVKRNADGPDLRDAGTTLLIHAGIAASDVLCCRRLGVHARGENHAAAVELVGQVEAAFATDLSFLLGLKTQAGYDARPVSGQQLKKALRAAERLVEAARTSR